MRLNLRSLFSPLLTFSETLKIFPRAFRGYGSRIIALSILGFGAGLIEGIGVNALVPLFGFFEKSGRHPTDFISQATEKLFAFLHIPFSVVPLLLFMIGLFVLRFLFVVLHGYIAARIQTGYGRRVRHELLERTVRADWPYLVTQKLGRLETLIKIDAPQSAALLSLVAALLMGAASLAAYLFVALNISQTVTVAALGFGALILILYRPLFRVAHGFGERISRLNEDIAHHINQSILGVKTVKALGAEDAVLGIGERLFEKSRRIQLSSEVLSRVTVESLQPLGIIFIAATVAFAFYRTSYNLGALAALVYLMQRVLLYTQNLNGTIYNMSNILPYAKNVVRYLEGSRQAQEETETGSGEFRFKEELRFDGVSFSYPDRGGTLGPISFSVRPGEMLGIVGPSGAGKTTIFDLLLRFLRPEQGRIEIDGEDIRGIDIKAWRKKISYVPHDIFILNDTIAGNIRFFDEGVDTDDIARAVKMAHLEEFVAGLPDGIDTAVGERGALISAGQRQRIALARALARRPAILLLDEATSALDAESEQHIQSATEELKKEMTILVIAHRLTTVLDADRLLVVEEGRIVEEGAPRELLKDKETYFYKTYNLRK
ncbi:MAG: ABC transporter ATP-binding protein [bacterium]|nr:ABC transporter ATP-binding protein [bacterium]